MRKDWRSWEFIHCISDDFDGSELKRRPILTRKERVDSQLFFQMAPEVFNLRGRSMKV